MTIETTIRFIEDELARTRIAYDSWFDVQPELLGYKPKEGWSIEEILEHVTLTNQFLLILIRKGKNKAKELAAKKDLQQAVLDYTYNLDELDQIARHKSFVWIRPEHMEPVGSIPLSQIKSKLEEQVKECQDILHEIPNGEGILYQTTMSVNALGKIDVYQYIYFLCQHAKRHLVQMQKVRDEFATYIS
ncbi:DinB family protein [Paenibacillus aurantiacus]|uniref:DinB family protein n=1 Tax=Paenibacillus aurantiacus TaxID=1936118 RepID=A0ABV5KH60_9BACL